MLEPERCLQWLLRAVGGVALLALPCVVLPEAWMDRVHQGLGLGPLPGEPIVGYLARSTSAFYTILGGLWLLLSFDLPRYRPVLVYMGAAILLLGATLLAVDWLEGLPGWWIAFEGPFGLVFGAAILLLARRLPPVPRS